TFGTRRCACCASLRGHTSGCVLPAARATRRERLSSRPSALRIGFAHPLCQVVSGQYQSEHTEGQMERGILCAAAAAVTMLVIAGCGGASGSSAAADEPQ